MRGAPPSQFGQSSLDFTESSLNLGPPPVKVDPPGPALPGWPQPPLVPLLILTLLCALLWFSVAQWLTRQPRLPLELGGNARHELVLRASALPELQPRLGQTIVAIDGEREQLPSPSSLLTERSARWLPDDALRERFLSQQQQLMRMVEAGPLWLQLLDGSRHELRAVHASLSALPAGFWLRALVASALAVAALAWLLVPVPQARRALALLSACQAVLVAMDAVDAGLGTPMPRLFLGLELDLRNVAELAMVGGIVQASCLHMSARLLARRINILCWLSLGLLALLLNLDALPRAWWWTQAGVQLAGSAALLVQYGSQRLQPHPWTTLFTRFTLPAVLIWPLVTWAVLSTAAWPEEDHALREVAPQIWSVGMTVLFLALPFMARSQRVAREVILWSALALGSLAVVLLWTAIRIRLPLPVLALCVLAALALGVVARWWLIHRVFERRPLRAAQLFDELYRTIRLVDTQPQQAQAAVTALFSSMFAPLKVELLERELRRSLIVRDGTGMIVPLPNLHRGEPHRASSRTALVLHGSQAGRRLFTLEDARLADLIAEQIRRAVLFDKAVEQGRSEERLRLAQDLHDDIGARLLTLMYKASTPEMEEYIRHTLKDLKTLTRGLAASNHSLSFACAEWKSDMTQRLAAVDCELQWFAGWDQDLELSVVQWSALTRILRELVSNAIAHAQASVVRIELNLEQGQLALRVQDNGLGQAPELWTHGLGLGGIRKRVKQLGGSVRWQAQPGAGILCDIHIQKLNPERRGLDVTRP
nr:ATP-binding protein [uncultured Roseateles sp.]